MKKLPYNKPQILLHAFWGFSTFQAFKLISYIKHYKVIVLNDSGNTHNFIYSGVAKETHCCICAIENFQIMIANGGMIKCGSWCENVKI